MKDILIIEDNTELATITADFLMASGLTVEVKASGEEGLSYLVEHEVKLLLLDIMLEGIDGFEVCTKVRALQSIPIVMMSALSDEESKILCLEIGADDYIEKPFTPKYLKAKINALLRRNYELKAKNTSVKISGLTIDRSKREVWRGEQKISLSVKEYELLLLLIDHHDEAMKKETLFDEVWGSDSFSEPSTLTVHIRWLREKLEKEPKKPKLITTVWGVGYCFNTVEE